MKYKLGLVILTFCLALAGMAVVAQSTPEENTSDSKKTEDAKPGNPDKPGAASNINLQVKILAEGKHPLPSGSRVELKGDEKSCEKVSRPLQNLESEGVASFPDLPACRVRLSIYITGFDRKSVPVDLTHYKDPLQILVKAVGPPVVN